LLDFCNRWHRSQPFLQFFSSPSTRLLHALERLHESVAQKSRHWNSQSQTLAQVSLVDACAKTESGTVRDQMQTREANTTAIARIVMTNSSIGDKKNNGSIEAQGGCNLKFRKKCVCIPRMEALPQGL
jgi:hypothetical protein